MGKPNTNLDKVAVKEDEKIPDELPPKTGEMEDAFEWFANRQAQRLAIPNQTGFTRKQIANAFQSAFELIGGVPRLALWAHHNEGDFYRLYAKMLPANVSQILGEDNTLRVIHSIAPSALDRPKEEIEDAEYEDSPPPPPIHLEK